jgi:hypothetical protein
MSVQAFSSGVGKKLYDSPADDSPPPPLGLFLLNIKEKSSIERNANVVIHILAIFLSYSCIGFEISMALMWGNTEVTLA